MPRRWLLLSLAAVVVASAGGVAVVAASAGQLAAPFANAVMAEHSGKCLTVPDGSGPLTQHSCAQATAGRQTFRFTPVGDGYTISPMGAPGCLGVPLGARGNGTPVQSAACTGGAEQTFVVAKASSGGYTVRNVQAGRCVDVSGKSTADGAAVIVWRCHDGANQRWQLDLSADPATPSPQPSSSPSASPSASPSPTSSPAPSPSGECVRQAGPAPGVKVTEVNVGTAVTDYGGEGDTEKLPMAIAAAPSGGSWLAWLGTDKRVYLGKLDCNDKLVGKATSFVGVDLQDVHADSTGGVLLLTREGECGKTKLCGGSASPCYTMHMIRFDNSGAQVWEQQVTNLGNGRAGYDNGARFVWWYQHHGRLASDGSNYAAYFGVAITVQNGDCVDIHEGDRMQVVSATGKLVSHQDSFEVGCSHSWGTRIVWDPRTSHYVMVCATDNGCRIAQPNPYRTVAAGLCDGTLFGGDLVLASTAGYWTAWSQGGQARLDHFTTGASDKTITTAARTQHPHLVSYGAGRMLLSWEDGAAMAAQVYDAASGAAVGSQFTIGVRDHDFQAFKSYADGSVAYPAAGSSTTSIRIARVMALSTMAR